MARSALGNPIQAGLDAFSQIRGEQRADDQLANNIEDRKLNRAAVTQKMGFESEQHDWEAANQAHKEWQQGVEEQQKELGPVIEEAKLIQVQGGKLEPRHINAIRKIHKLSPVFDNDPAIAAKQTEAFGKLDELAARMNPELLRAANGKISRESAPELIGNFNLAYKNIIDAGVDDKGEKPLSKTVEEVIFRNGNLIPIVKTVRQDGTEYLAPMTKGRDGSPDAQAIEIPAGLFASYNKEHSDFGKMVEAATGYVGGDSAPVKEAVNLRTLKGLGAVEDEALKAYKAVDTTGMDLSEKRLLLREKLREKGYTGDAHKIATELVQEKKSGLSGKVVEDKDSSTGYSYLDDDGETLVQGAPPPKKDLGDETLDLKRFDLETRRLDRREKLEEKQKAKRDTRIKEHIASIRKVEPEISEEEAQDRAKKLVDAEDSGKEAFTTDDKKKKRLQPLKDKFGKVEKDGLNAGFLVKSAVEKGWSEEDIKVAAGDAPKSVQDAVEKYYRKASEEPARKVDNPRKAATKDKKSMDTMPLPNQYVNKILRDKTTGKRYKSDGKRWNEIQ